MYREFDEIDIAMTCLMSEADFFELENASNQEITYIESMNIEESNIDSLSILLDESETDPIGLEAEEDIDVEQELLLGEDDDDELIDLVSQEK